MSASISSASISSEEDSCSTLTTIIDSQEVKVLCEISISSNLEIGIPDRPIAWDHLMPPSSFGAIEIGYPKGIFKARPMPDLRYRPPIVTATSKPKAITVPEPFELHSKPKPTEHILTEDDIELAKKFNASPVPAAIYEQPKMKTSKPRPPTKPKPFRFNINARLDGLQRKKKIENFPKEVKTFKAKPIPGSTYHPQAPGKSKFIKKPTVCKPFQFLTRNNMYKPSQTQCSNATLETYIKESVEEKKLDNHVKKYSNVLTELSDKRTKSTRLSVSTVSTSSTESPNSKTETNQSISGNDRKNIGKHGKENTTLDRTKILMRKATTAVINPEGFYQRSMEYHRKKQELLKAKRDLEEKNLKQLSASFKAAPILQKNFAMPSTKERPILKAKAPTLQTSLQAEQRAKYDNKIKQLQLVKETTKAVQQMEKQRKEINEIKKLRRKSIEEGGICFAAKPINYILKQKNLGMNALKTFAAP